MLFQFTGMNNTNKDSQRDSPDTSIGRAKETMVLFLPGPAPSFLLFIVFGTTAPFRKVGNGLLPPYDLRVGACAKQSLTRDHGVAHGQDIPPDAMAEAARPDGAAARLAPFPQGVDRHFATHREHLCHPRCTRPPARYSSAAARESQGEGRGGGPDQLVGRREAHAGHQASEPELPWSGSWPPGPVYRRMRHRNRSNREEVCLSSGKVQTRNRNQETPHEIRACAMGW